MPFVAPSGLEGTIQAISCAGAILWIIYKIVRWECISTARVLDQIGMACWTLSLTILASRLGTMFAF